MSKIKDTLLEIQGQDNLNKDYQVVSTYTGGMFKEPILNGATISVKGAIFKIERQYTVTGKPTSIFEFKSLISFVDDDFNNESVEIGWDTNNAGLDLIGRELGLKYHNGSVFGYNIPHFEEIGKPMTDAEIRMEQSENGYVPYTAEDY